MPCLEVGASQPELIGDPGVVPSGGMLLYPTQVIDAGMRAGRDYGTDSGTPQWSVGTDAATTARTYRYVCTLHDWMRGARHADIWALSSLRQFAEAN